MNTELQQARDYLRDFKIILKQAQRVINFIMKCKNYTTVHSCLNGTRIWGKQRGGEELYTMT